ncbi:hypothetical protein C2845_PM11G18120 [Panicum miliaceum]|uniref:DUF4220 domain-containing protein n=1 Tax=Panicum miliaceum TaxID=4540 RepID=A0A3L6RUS2_PANMI|nr:hypothetical protein C2845_PM11G18120 [Panicum miliaceum]
MLEWFQSNSSERRCNVYEQVGEILVDFYQDLYTKNPLRKPFVSSSYSFIRKCVCNQQEPCSAVVCCALCCICHGPFLLYDLFQYVSTPIALVLFWAAEKGGQEQPHSRAVIAVSYTLLVGAIVLDVSFATISISSKYIPLPAAAWSKKQWSEELAQYSMIKRHVVQDTAGMASSIRQWIGRHLGAWGFDLLELTHAPITEDCTPIKEFILDNLLVFGTRKKWSIASSHGGLALKDWMDKHQGPDCERLRKALVKTIGSDVDFPTSVLIWHIATDICYYFEDNGSTDSSEMKKHKRMSREISNYIMYLVFKSGVMLTTNSQYVHEKAHDEISTLLSGPDQQGQQVTTLQEKAAVIKLFQAKKNDEQQDQSAPAVDIEKRDRFKQKLLQNTQELDSPTRAAVMKFFQGRKKEEQQDQSALDTEKHEESVDNNSAADTHHLQKLSQSAQDLYSPVLPRACKVAQEFISIDDDTERWDLSLRCGRRSFFSLHLVAGLLSTTSI